MDVHGLCRGTFTTLFFSPSLSSLKCTTSPRKRGDSRILFLMSMNVLSWGKRLFTRLSLGLRACSALGYEFLVVMDLNLFC